MAQQDIDFQTNLSTQLEKVKRLVLDHYKQDQANLKFGLEMKANDQEDKFKSVLQSKKEEAQQLKDKVQKLKKKLKKQKKCKKKSVNKLWLQKILQIYFQAWLKFLKEKKHRNKLQLTANEKVEQAKVKIHCDYASELERLNKIVQRLSEDIRAEKLEKETLKYQFDQAFQRGQYALQMERSILSQKKLYEQMQD